MNIRKLCPELAEKARRELNEDPDRVIDDINYIKAWIAKQPHLRARIDDQWILSFLRGCKFSLERTKEKLDLYYTLKTSAPEFWKLKYGDPKLIEILSLGGLLILPKTTDVLGPRIGLARFGHIDPNKYHITEIFSAFNVIQEIIMYEDDVLMVNGTSSLIDIEGISSTHMMQMSPGLMKKMTVLAQDAIPVRMKGTHYVSMPSVFETLFNFMKNLMNEKNKSRIYIHKSYDELYKHIPKEALPEEYGGEGGKVQDIIDYWINKVHEYGPWLKAGENCGTDESKRPGKPKTAEELFGLEGSFRQLQFD